MTVGVTHKRSTVLPSAYIGNRHVDGGVFQVGANPSTKLPIIRSKDTGRVWTPSWEGLIRLAIAEGLLDSDDDLGDQYGGSDE